jgi:hypothetical protein
LIILDDGYQCTLRHSGFLGTCPAGVPNVLGCRQVPNVGEGSQQSNAGTHKPWLMAPANRLGKMAVDLEEL